MKTSLYLTDFEKETIKNNTFYKLKFFDNINGLVFGTYIEENTLKNNYIDLITNGTPETIKKLQEDLKTC